MFVDDEKGQRGNESNSVMKIRPPIEPKKIASGTSSLFAGRFLMLLSISIAIICWPDGYRIRPAATLRT
jgi:hypothetical protein